MELSEANLLVLGPLEHVYHVFLLELLDEELRLTEDDSHWRDDEKVSLGVCVLDPQVQLRFLFLDTWGLAILVADTNLLEALDDLI